MRARAAGVVARHAAQRRLCGGGDVHRVPQAQRLQLRVQVIQHHAGFHDGRARARIHLDHLVAGTWSRRSPAPAPTVWPHWEVPAPRGRIGTPSSSAICMPRSRASSAVRGHDHAHGHHLVDRCVGRVAPAARGIEEHLAVHLADEAPGQRRSARRPREDARAAAVGEVMGAFTGVAYESGRGCGIMSHGLQFREADARSMSMPAGRHFLQIPGPDQCARPRAARDRPSRPSTIADPSSRRSARRCWRA